LGENHFKGFCNKWIHVTNTQTGKSITAKVRDECVSCKGTNNIGMFLCTSDIAAIFMILMLASDLSPSAFDAIGPKAQGVLPVVWHYEKEGWSP
jgi:hypothetical protein